MATATTSTKTAASRGKNKPATQQPATKKPAKQKPVKQKSTSKVADYEPKYPIPDMKDVLQRFSQIKGIHSACAAVPPILPQHFDKMVDVMRKDKQLDPVLVDPNGNLIDGRNRLRVCYVLGITPIIETRNDDPWARALANVARRHLTTGQLASFAARPTGRGRSRQAVDQQGRHQSRSSQTSQACC